jgi:tetratricopeptide (TPR) repeat protein
MHPRNFPKKNQNQNQRLQSITASDNFKSKIETDKKPSFPLQNQSDLYVGFSFKKLYNKKYKSMVEYAINLSKEGRYVESIELMDKLINSNPQLAKLHSKKALIHLENFNYQLAIDCALHCIESNKKDSLAYRILISSLLKLQRYDEALNYSKQEMETLPHLAYTYWNRGKILMELKEYRKSGRSLRRAIKLIEQGSSDKKDINIGLILADLGKLASKKKRYESALEFYSKSFELNPENINLYKRMGLCYYKMGMDIYLDMKKSKKTDELESKILYKQAMVYLDIFSKKTIFVGPEVYTTRASCLFHTGKHKQAIDELKRCMIKFPNYKMASKKLNSYSKIMGYLDKMQNPLE